MYSIFIIVDVVNRVKLILIIEVSILWILILAVLCNTGYLSGDEF